MVSGQSGQFADQVPFAAATFADNPEPRCPCLLLLDTSGSMSGSPIAQLNDALVAFKEELAQDSLAVKRVEVAIVEFGPVRMAADFQTVDLFQPPTLAASGDTPIGGAVQRGVEMVEQRKGLYRENGISYYRPWIFLFTDGAPTDAWKSAAEVVHKGEGSKAFMFFAVGVGEANMDVLKQLSVRDPVRLQGLKFREFFSWLSNSLSSVSRSQVGDAVPLDNPTAPGGWAVAG